MRGALDGLLVVDLGQHLAAPMVAMVLGELGAEVIRVDKPDGPVWNHPSNAVLQRGKKNIVLDAADPGERQVLADLIYRADILVESFAPGHNVTEGLSPQETTTRNPRLIHLSLPGFSTDDPRAAWPAWDGVLNAAAGFYLYPGCSPMDYVGDRTQEPIFSSIPQASFMGALVALHSVAAALYARERSGLGQHIDMSLHEASFELVGASAMRTEVPRDKGPSLNSTMPQLGHYQGSDGEWLELCLFQDKHLAWFGEHFMDPEWVADGMADMDRMLTDPDLRARARERFSQLIATRPARDWEKAINDVSGASAALSQSTKSWLRDDEDARDNRLVIDLHDPILGPTAQAGYPIALSRTPMQTPGPRRLLDADRSDVLAIAGRPRAVHGPGAEPGLRQALAGIKVIDTSQVLAGPTTSRILAEYGAEVIKIHSFEDRQLGMHPYTNSGKRSIMLNLKTQEGQDIFQRLSSGVDVFVQNFARGVAERLGIGPADVRSVSPDAVYTSISAFGYCGYRGAWRGREQLGQGVTGMQTRLAGPGREPEMAPFAYCDFSTGNFAAFGTIIALYHRLRTGETQDVHASLSGTGSFLQLPYLLDYDGAAHDEPSGPDAKGRGPLDRLYRTADRWIYLAAGSHQVPQISSALDFEASCPDEVSLTAAIQDRLFLMDAATAVEALVTHGIGAHVLRDLTELMDDPYALAKGLVITRHHPGLGKVTLAGPSPRLTRTPALPTFPAGAPGSDTRSILEGLGYGEQIEQLIETGVVRDGLPAGTQFVGLFR